jgi:hypothetical protein
LANTRRGLVMEGAFLHGCSAGAVSASAHTVRVV